MLTGQDLGRNHETALGAGFYRRCQRKERNHRLSGSDVSLEQPQHALGRRHVLYNGFNRRFLRGGQSERQPFDNFAAKMSAALDRSSLAALHMMAHEEQCQLVGEKLIIGKPLARRRCFNRVWNVVWLMNALQSRREA